MYFVAYLGYFRERVPLHLLKLHFNSLLCKLPSILFSKDLFFQGLCTLPDVISCVQDYTEQYMLTLQPQAMGVHRKRQLPLPSGILGNMVEKH